MIIEIEPLDTVIFRDGKPFSRGDDSWTDSLNLPTPTTIYGALRGTYFSQNPNDFKKIKEDDVTESLIIKGIYLYKDNEFFYKVPKDCVYKLDSEEITILRLSQNFLTSSPLDYNLSLDVEVEGVENKILDGITFDDYLKGENTLYGEDLDNFITVENKIGIGRDKITNTTKDGLLYRVQMLRYEFKIVVAFEGLKLNSFGLMKFGGEAKGANYKELKSVDLPSTPTINSSIFKLYLLTPAIFDKGWLPKWIDKKNMIGEYKGVKLKLLTCAIGKYQSIGGFDMKINRPKEMFKTIPASSVYYFEILDGEKDRVVELFHNQSISDQRANEGYGVAIVSEVKE
jgi:CRISPR-associated protein Cmr3